MQRIEEMVKVAALSPHPQNDYFFDRIEGVEQEEFVESIKMNGVMERIIVTQDMTIVSGHRRVEACKEIGLDTIPAEIRTYDSEDDVVRDMIEVNIRRRNGLHGSKLKIGRVIKELERLNSNNPNNVGEVGYGVKGKVAEQVGIKNDETYRQYRSLADTSEGIQGLIEQKVISPSTVAKCIAELPIEQQEELILSLPNAKHFTQKELEPYIAQIKELQSENLASERQLEKQIRLNYEQQEAHEAQMADLRKKKNVSDELITQNNELKAKERAEYEATQQLKRELAEAKNKAKKAEACLAQVQEENENLHEQLESGVGTPITFQVDTFYNTVVKFISYLVQCKKQISTLSKMDAEQCAKACRMLYSQLASILSIKDAA